MYDASLTHPYLQKFDHAVSTGGTGGHNTENPAVDALGSQGSLVVSGNVSLAPVEFLDHDARVTDMPAV
jgi:hypothetical protein